LGPPSHDAFALLEASVSLVLVLSAAVLVLDESRVGVSKAAFPSFARLREWSLIFEYEYRCAEYEPWIAVGSAIRVSKWSADAYIVEVLTVP